MDSLKRFKLFKKGKLWLSAAICTLAVGVGGLATQPAAHAAASFETAPTSTGTSTSQIHNRFYNQNGQTY